MTSQTIKRYKKLYKTQKPYTIGEIEAITEANNLIITYCDEDEFPHITISDSEDGDPIWKFNWVSADTLTLTWTEWDK